MGNAVALGIKEGVDLSDLSLAQLQQFSDAIGEDVFDYLTLEGSLAARDHLGGTAPNQVKQAVINGRARLKAFAWSNRFKRKLTDRAISDTRY